MRFDSRTTSARMVNAPMRTRAMRPGSRAITGSAHGRPSRSTLAVEGGAEAVLLLSSDLPLVTFEAVRGVIESATRLDAPVAIAVAATGRGGTNALYLRPPGAITLQFGSDSLDKFRHEAESRGVNFVVHHSESLALDLDEPGDLVRLRRAV